MTWDNFRRPIEYNGVRYGTKEREFGRVEELPGHTAAALEVAVGGDAPRERWRQRGWSVLEAQTVSRTAGDYRAYVQGSRGEFSVAKNVYAATRCGWFSCRSVCYLAAGRPVVAQDTGFAEIIPTGRGLLAFSDLESAAEALAAVEANYGEHQEAARTLARRHFASDVVLGKLLEQVGLG
jgi:glycosyltransferase involved in cell wall biosynthesis